MSKGEMENTAANKLALQGDPRRAEGGAVFPAAPWPGGLLRAGWDCHVKTSSVSLKGPREFGSQEPRLLS